MAKFCGNCGTELVDNAKICGNCGTSLTNSSLSIVGLDYGDSIKKNKNKKVTKHCFIVILLIIIIVVASKAVSSFVGYNGLIRKVMAAYEDFDIDALVLMSSDMYFYDTEDFVEYYFKDNIGDDLDIYEASVGHSYKISYEIDESYNLSDRKSNELLDEISAKYTNFDINIIKKIIVADLTITAKNGSKTIENDLRLTMSKEGDSWKLLYING